MKFKQSIWIVLPTIAVIFALLTWTIFTPSYAIVEARVTLTAPYGNGFLAQVSTTHAFQTSDGGWLFEVWSKCSLSLNQIIDIRVSVSPLSNGSHPDSFEASLYKGNSVGFAPWDGC